MRRDLESQFQEYRDHGSARALARVFDATARDLLAVARHLTRADADAEDLVQATYVTAMEKARAYDANRRVLPWLLGILGHHARKLHADRGRPLPEIEVSASHDAHASLAEAELSGAVDAAVESLPPAYSTLLGTYLREGLPPRELARRFDLSPNAARVRLHRGLKLLRRALPAGLAGGVAATTTGRGLAAVRANVLARTGETAPAASLAPWMVAAAAIVVTGGTWFALESRAGGNDPEGTADADIADLLAAPRDTDLAGSTVAAPREPVEVDPRPTWPEIPAEGELLRSFPTPDQPDMVVLRVKSPPLSFKSPKPEHVRLYVGEDEPRIPGKRSPNMTGYFQYTFRDVPPGTWRLVLDDPNLEGIDIRTEPGWRHDVEWRPRASLVLDVSDSDGHLPFELVVHYPHENVTPKQKMTVARTAMLADGRVRFGRVYPGHLRLRVKAEGHADALYDLDDAIGPDDERNVRIELDARTTVFGTLVDDEGEPIAGHEIELTRGSVPGLSGMSFASYAPHAESTVRTDGDGEFVIADLSPGAWYLRARFGEWLAADASLDLGEDELGELEVTLARPPSGSLRGRVLLPPGDDAKEVKLYCAPEAGDWHLEFSAEARCEEDGSFAIAALPAGDAKLSVYPGNGKAVDLGVVFIPAGETVEKTIDLR